MTVVPYQGSRIRTKRLAVAGKVTADEAIIGDLKITGVANEFQLRNDNLNDNINNSCLVQLADGETTVGAAASKALNFKQGGVTKASVGTDGNWDFNTPINVNGLATIINTQISTDLNNSSRIANVQSGGDMRFTTTDSNNNLVEKIKLQNSGRLIVGHDFVANATAPSGSELFHNAGTTRLVGDTTIDGAAILNDGLTLTGEIITNGDIKSGTSNDLVLECQTNNGEIKFQTKDPVSNSIEQRATITPAGALCINAVAPTGTEKLNVNGDVNVTGDVDATTMTIGNRVITTTPLEKLFVEGAVGVLGNFKILGAAVGGNQGLATFRVIGGPSSETGSNLEIDPTPAGTQGNKGTVEILGKLNVKADTTVKGTLTINKSDDVTVQAKIYTEGTDSGGNDNPNTTLVLDPEPFTSENNNGVISCRGRIDCFRGLFLTTVANLNFNGSTGAVINNETNNGFIRFILKENNTASDKMRLTNSGRLVIGHDYSGGAADPVGTEKLYVDGDASVIGNFKIIEDSGGVGETALATLRAFGGDSGSSGSVLEIDPSPDGTTGNKGTVNIEGNLDVKASTVFNGNLFINKAGDSTVQSKIFTEGTDSGGGNNNNTTLVLDPEPFTNENNAGIISCRGRIDVFNGLNLLTRATILFNGSAGARLENRIAGGYMSFFNENTQAEKMRLTNSGRLVIGHDYSGGAADPAGSEKLYVDGDATVTDKLTVVNQPEIHNQVNEIANIGYLKVENIFSSSFGRYMALRNTHLTGTWSDEAALIQNSSGFTYLGSKASQEIRFNQGGTTRGQVNTNGTWTFNTGVTMPFTTVNSVITNSVASTANLSFSCANGSALFFGRSGVTPEFKMNTDGTFSFLNEVTCNNTLHAHDEIKMGGLASKIATGAVTNLKNHQLVIRSTDGTSYTRLIRDNANANTEYRMSIEESYVFTMTTAGIDIAGTVKSNGTTLTSDDRLKINEQPLLGALSVIRQIKPQSYLKIKDEADLDGSFNVGVIAQELYQIPQLQFAVKVPDEPTRMEDNFVKETIQETVIEYEEITETITEEDLSGNITTREVVTQNPVEVTRDKEIEVNRPYEVTNYWSVDYNALSVYNIAAVKELDSNVSKVAAEVLLYKEQLQSQAAVIESLIARIAALEAN